MINLITKIKSKHQQKKWKKFQDAWNNYLNDVDGKYHIESYLKYLDKTFGEDESEINESLYDKKYAIFNKVCSSIKDCIMRQTEGFEQNYLLRYFNYLIQPTYKELEELRMKCNPIGE